MQSRVVSRVVLVVAVVAVAAWATSRVPSASSQGPSLTVDDVRAYDLVFHRSRSAQSAGIEEATGSPLTHVGLVLPGSDGFVVLEAERTVRLTPLPAFRARGRGGWVEVARLVEPPDPRGAAAIRRVARRSLGAPYDRYFEWGGRAVYCSELVHRVLHEAIGVEVGVQTPLAELRTDGPAARALLRDRTRGRRAPRAILTPVAMTRSVAVRRVGRLPSARALSDAVGASAAPASRPRASR